MRGGGRVGGGRTQRGATQTGTMEMTTTPLLTLELSATAAASDSELMIPFAFGGGEAGGDCGGYTESSRFAVFLPEGLYPRPPGIVFPRPSPSPSPLPFYLYNWCQVPREMSKKTE